MNISVLLITIRQLRKKSNSIDIKLQCDDPTVFKAIVDDMPGTFHYKKSTWAYRTVKGYGGSSIDHSLTKFLQDYVTTKSNIGGTLVIPKFILEEIPSDSLPTVTSTFSKFIIQ